MVIVIVVVIMTMTMYMFVLLWLCRGWCYHCCCIILCCIYGVGGIGYVVGYDGDGGGVACVSMNSYLYVDGDVVFDVYGVCGVDVVVFHVGVVYIVISIYYDVISV